MTKSPDSYDGSTFDDYEIASSDNASVYHDGPEDISSGGQVSQPSHPSNSRNNGCKKRALAAAFFCVALVLILAGIGIGANLHPKSNVERDPNVQVGSLTGAGGDLDKIVDESMVSFSINTDPLFPDGTSPGNLTIENLAINNNRFTVTINLKDQNREVYRSGFIDPGQFIAEAPLSVDLPQGDYPAVATLQTFRLSDDSPLGQVAAELVLHVEG